MEFTLVLWNAQADEMAFQAWALVKELEKRSNGLIKFKFLGGVEVVPALEQPEAIKKRVVDIGWIPSSYWTGSIPESPAPGNTRMSSLERRKAGIEDLLNELSQKKGAYYLMNLDSSKFEETQRIFLNVKIEKPEDLKGLRMRTAPLFRPMLQYFGAVPVTMSGSDTYSAMERGLIQGFAFPADSPVIGYSLPEVTKYYVTPGFGGPQVSWWWNLDSWKSIPADLQKLIKDTTVDIEREWESKMYDTHLIWVDKFNKAGMKEIVLPKDAGERLVTGYYDSCWEDIIKQSPTYGPKLRELAGMPPLKTAK